MIVRPSSGAFPDAIEYSANFGQSPCCSGGPLVLSAAVGLFVGVSSMASPAYEQSMGYNKVSIRVRLVYSLPVEQTTLRQFVVFVTTVSGEETIYSIFQDPNEGDHPGDTAIKWLDEDLAEEDGDDESTGDYDVREYGVLDSVEGNNEAKVNQSLDRYYGKQVFLKGDRLYFDSLEYAFLPVSIDDFASIEEYNSENGLDLQRHNEDEVIRLLESD